MSKARIQMNEIIPLLPAQRESSVSTLTAAFSDDVMWRAILPDESERQRVMPMMWRGVIAYCQQYGIVSTTPDMQGIAAWTKPRHAHPTLWKQLRTGFLLPRSVMLMSKPSRERFLGVMKQIEALHRQLMPRPHWYLWALGVDPAHQRQGMGGDLLQPGVARAQADGAPCYLETETEGNVTFYRKQGFDVLHEAEIVEGGFRLWFMHKPDL
jgi:ribosomal protein S18 acetylase RimI-like enzyme